MSESTLHELAEANRSRLSSLAEALDVDDPTGQTQRQKSAFLGFDSPPAAEKSLSDADRTAALIKENAAVLERIAEAVDDDPAGSEKAAFLGMED
ncbi:hypothetical protein SAMN04488063_0007 [Halopelagius inordinatus]|uniref:Uncharacterized protein n=1 Tax=Halopelagius inordinatus TaxID=553467 RepID=A0A1I2WUP7_9EURY|nr:hypothetical protein [Halopelagius inordinatus]SFH05033.1 hypothetical protein SAMN04488063_0007 [Halopelagius inordinatus]